MSAVMWQSVSKGTGTLLALATAASVLVAIAPEARASAAPDPAVVQALQRLGNGTWSNADVELIASNPALADKVPDPRVPAAVDAEEIEYEVFDDGTMQAISTTGLSQADESKAWDAVRLPDLIKGPKGQDVSEADEVEVPEETDPVSAVAAGDARAANVEAAAGRWKTKRVSITHKSLLGTTLYKYHHRARFKYNGSKVTAWGARSDYTSNENGFVQVGNRTRNEKTRLPAASAHSLMKRRIDLCMPVYGCYDTLYPWIKIKMKGSGATSHDSRTY
ncbi:hypothetical protein ACFWIA_12050 [Streptomyces sp. NPDC127068]|uniref:hypothetical protein n=1 Tax=Streptomyces sp. NPDC127068 TaxID=3347127 RepID=UPI003653E9FA